MSSKIASLDARILMAESSAQAGLDDFGDLEFVQRCEQWLLSVDNEAHLDSTGLTRLAMVVRGWLVNRLRWVDDLKRHPEINAEVIREPIFVTGMPRTGTTKLQRVLASDAAVQSLPFWQALNFAPLPGQTAGQPDPRIAIAAGFIGLISQFSADFLTAHPAFADAPEEESFLIETDFQSQANCTRVRAPSFWQQVKDSPGRESLTFLKRILQYVQWQRGAAGARPWVLKSPLHIGNLDSLFETFPDAVVIHTYRDPLIALPSSCRIVEVFRRLFTEDIGLAELGSEQLGWWSQILLRHMAQRDRLASGRVFDVSYEDIHRDVLCVVRDLYSRMGRPLDGRVERHMRDWEASHPQHQFGRHVYSLERYGLTEEAVRSAFSAYIDRFGGVGSASLEEPLAVAIPRRTL
jgi:hypothetical protein